MKSVSKEPHRKPLVSVVVIFYNAAKFIREAIDSVESQSYGNWELLLVDDGSTDRSSAIARAYADAHSPKVRYLAHEGHANKGMSASRNLGIARARGEFIALLDADDLWLREKLEKQVSIIERHPDVGLVVNPAYYWHEDGTKIPQPMMLSPGRLGRADWAPKILADDNNAACTCGVLLRTSFARFLGGFEESFRGLFEDQVMWLKASMNSAVYYDPECLALYRIHPSSCCVSAPIVRQREERKKLYLWLSEYVTSHPSGGLKSELLKIMLRCKLWDIAVQERMNGSTRSGNSALPSSPADSLKTPEPSRYSSAPWCRAADLLLKAIFTFSAAAYSDGFAQGFKTVGTAATKTCRTLLPNRVRRIVRTARRALLRAWGIANSPRTRLRAIFGEKPLSERWGMDRGLPVHRYYLEEFLKEFSSDIRGHCLEFQESPYTTHFGGDRVTKIDILHKDMGNANATIVADLTMPNDIPSNQFDCIVCTHVLHVIFEMDKAISELYRIMKPGAVLLLAVPHVSMCDPDWHELWRFTPEGLSRILAKVFGSDNVTIRAYGNSLTAAAELRGLVAGEFTKAELNYRDPRFAVEICARAVKQS